MRLESLLESFTAKTQGLKSKDYWERLSVYRTYSVSRRFEHYRILDCNKILNGESQNCGVSWTYLKTTGFKFDVPKFGKHFTMEREKSFNYAGPALHNTLPLYLRLDKLSTENWKEKLDNFLEDVPDHPITTKLKSGLCDQYTTLPTNSLIKWIPHLGLSGKRKATK